MAGKEPQSYGSQGEWVRGETGGEVSQQKGKAPAARSDFYDGRASGDDNAAEGGYTPAVVEVAAHPEPGKRSSELTSRKVSAEDGGARRSSFFKDRDYPG